MFIPESLNQITNSLVAQNSPVTIGATCIAQLAPAVFVLLVEIEVQVPGEDIEEVLIISLTPAQAAALLPPAGTLRLCEIVGRDEIPTPAPGRDVELICAFVFRGNVFLVFDVETNTTDELVLVRVPLCPIVGED
ncbi:hypothetical protein [Clostridium sp. HMP27]|uniref:hypothetical protein n=1 Tax=Clostridium sp. HMP27 TaxID=1487921 RepID=UPI00052DFFDF|nr:hypothetical protein [Clostridium sp. HMP27]KGK90097.1 spore coat protein [Clostridium sp. HMP27]